MHQLLSLEERTFILECSYSLWDRRLVSSSEALPLSYRRLVAAREFKLGTLCDMSVNMLSGKLSKIVILKNPAFAKCWFNAATHMHMLWFNFILGLIFSRALACETRAGGAPWVRKYGKLPIRENLVITWPYTDRLWPSVRTTGIPM